MKKRYYYIENVFMQKGNFSKGVENSMRMSDPKEYLKTFISGICESCESYAFAYVDTESKKSNDSSIQGTLSEYIDGKNLGGESNNQSISVSPLHTLSAIKRAVCENKSLLIIHSHPPYYMFSLDDRVRFSIFEQAGFSKQDWKFMEAVARVYMRVAKNASTKPLCFVVTDGVYYQAVAFINKSYEVIWIDDFSLVNNTKFHQEVKFGEKHT